jgi:hypothetical protein
MANQIRNARRLATLSLAITLVIALPTAAHASRILIGEFYFDRPDFFDPVVHLSNLTDPSASPLQTFDFTITFVNDVTTGDVTVTATETRSRSSFVPTDDFQILPTDLAPAGSVVTMLSAELTSFLFSVPGTIAFSEDGGLSFVDAALLDFVNPDQSFGIWFEAPEPPVGVPESGTMAPVLWGLLLAGLVAHTLSRRRRRLL